MTTDAQLLAPQPRPSSLLLFLRVVGALVLRESRTRFGRSRIGYAWAVLEPAAWIFLFVFLHGLIAQYPPYGQSSFLFFASGVLPYRLYSALAGRISSAITANAALLTYPVVRPFDTMVARMVLEAATLLVVMLGAWFVIFLTEDIQVIHHPTTILFAVLATILFGSALGAFNAVVSALFPAWDRIFGVFSMPIMLTSGMFYVPNQLPPVVLDILRWQPVLHAIEWFRTGIYLDYTPVLDKTYLISLSLTLLLVALVLERLAREKILEQ